LAFSALAADDSEALKVQIQQLQSQNKQLQSDIEQLRTLNTRNQGLLSQNQRLQSKSEMLELQNEQLRGQNQQLQAHVARLQHAIIYTVNSDMMFESGSWEMSDWGKDVIAMLARKLAPAQEDRLVVSGYTDNVPIGQSLKRQGIATNQDLSQKRADAVREFLISEGVRPDMVTAQGFGDADPVAPNDTEEGRAQNRRVVLTVGGGGDTAQGSSVPH
jgi:chemotaxis protein MotB